ncbi:MAG: multicopper oxidase family protein [Xenococcaceae cyanobacterium MO_234.B1]|nr:multicopper oxidase family protein [Xenococcaceae cyanobacterium MO_234.B1]
MAKINRRQFLALGVGSAGAIIAANWVKGQNSNLIVQSKIASPSLYKSQDGLLEVNLEAGYTPLKVAGMPANLISYNGQIPAPRLEVKPGDTVRIHFTNNLSQPTNIHYHGLHITPTDKGDNIFLKIPSGEKFTYEFTILQNHSGGSFWYHPHYHGYVADQLLGGLAGLFIVRGKLDAIPEIKAAKEEFLVLKDFDIAGNTVIAPNHRGRMSGREGLLITGNGQINPNFELPRNGLLRLRLLNASSSHFYRLKLENHPFYLIATDGGALAEPVELTELLLVPGERAELLIPGTKEPGSYRLLNLPYDRGSMGMMGGMMGHRHRFSVSTSPQTIATITYGKPVKPVSLPNKLIPITILPEPKIARRFELNHGMIPGQGMAFLINGESFNPNHISTQVKLNAIEDWELVNTGIMDHPFHLHVNQFQILSRDGKSLPYLAGKDTVNVSPGETVRLRVKFNDFTGKTVYILDHEDLGMMAIMEILA